MKKLSADSRPTVGQLSVDCASTVGRLSADRRPTVGGGELFFSFTLEFACDSRKQKLYRLNRSLNTQIMVVVVVVKGTSLFTHNS